MAHFDWRTTRNCIDLCMQGLGIGYFRRCGYNSTAKANAQISFPSTTVSNCGVVFGIELQVDRKHQVDL